MKKNLLFAFTGILCNITVASAFQQDTLATDVDTVKWVTGCDPLKIKSNNGFNVSAPTVLRVLDGRIPGLQMTNGGGQPGASPEMLLRGLNSVNGSQMPLILLDGYPYYGSISALDPQDIDHITVLKDASATAGYGSRSANGIVQIYTKKNNNGQQGKLNINAQVGMVTRQIKDYDVIQDEKTFYETKYASLNSFLTPQQLVNAVGGYNAYNVPDNQLLTAEGKINPSATLRYNDDWREALQRTGLRHDYHVSFGNKTDKSNYYIGAGYLNEQGYLKGTSYERFSATFNGDHKFTPWLKAGITGHLTRGSQHFPLMDGQDNPIYVMREMAPIYPVYFYDANNQKVTDPETGKYMYDLGDINTFPDNSMGFRTIGPNTVLPYALENDRHQRTNLNYIITPYTEATLWKQITFRAGMQYNGISGKQSDIMRRPGGMTRDVWTDLNSRLGSVDQTISWKPKLGDHHLELNARHEDFWVHTKSFSSAFSSGQPTGTASSLFTTTYQSISFNAAYDYKEKYYLQASITRDWSDYIVPEYRGNNFWTVAAAYRIKEEDFLKNAEGISELKLRASYGIQGTSGLPPAYFEHQAIDYSQYSDNVYGQGVPERSKHFNVGLDAAFFNNRLGFCADAYERRNTTVLAGNGPAPSNVPFTFPLSVRNRGVEAIIWIDVIRRNKKQWKIQANIASNSNTITDTKDVDYSLHYGGFVYEKGGSLRDISVAEYAGVEAATGQALYWINTPSGKGRTADYGMLTADDYVNVGSIFPKAFGSLRNSISWMRFDLDVQVNFSIGGKYYDAVYARLMGNGITNGNWHTDILDYWTPENTTTDIPRLNVNDRYSSSTSTRFVRDASYLNLKTITLRYTFPSPKVLKAKLKELSIYATADNVWLFAGRQGMDPQASMTSVVGNVYSPARTIMLGVHVGL